MTDVVDEAASVVDAVAHVGGGCALGLVELIHGVVAIVHQFAADDLHVLLVALAVVSLAASAFVGGNSNSLGNPGVGRAQITFIFHHLPHLRLHIGHVFCRKAADEDVRIVVAARKQCIGGV